MDHRRILAETFVASAEHHEVIGSTNDRARQCAAEDPALPRLITADRQTAGRGRGVNRWWTGQGSPAMSLLLPVEMMPRNLAQSVLVSLVAGVSVVEAVQPLIAGCTGATAGLPSSAFTFCTAGQASSGAPDSRLDCALGLHWPNDVMLGGHKLAGILVGALPGRQHVVGIGINTNSTASNAPAELRERIATLRDATGVTCDDVELVVRLLQRFELGLRPLGTTPQDVARRADELCLQQGHTLTIRTGDAQITGRCRGIAPDGALLVEVAGGVRACYSGVVQP